MILTVFAIIFVLGCFAIVLGYATGDDYYGLAGLFLLFILSYILMTGNLTVNTGSNATVTFTYENGTITNQGVAVIDTYTAVNDATTIQLARILALAFGFGMALLSYNIYVDRKKHREEDE